MSDDHRSRDQGDPVEHDSPFPWMQGELEEEITPPFRPWMIAVAAASMVIFVVAVWYAWSEGQSADGPPPLVQANKGPVKVTPDEPGGMEVPHQENEIFAAIEDTPEEPVEELLPPPEEPVDLSEGAAMAEAEPAPAPAPQTKTQAVAPAPTPAPKPAAPVQTAASGGFVIQLAALQSRAAAEEAWQRLTKAHKPLAGLNLDIEPVNVPGKGTFYRLRGAAFKTEAEATAACEQLKAAGQPCLVKAR